MYFAQARDVIAMVSMHVQKITAEQFAPWEINLRKKDTKHLAPSADDTRGESQAFAHKQAIDGRLDEAHTDLQV